MRRAVVFGCREPADMVIDDRYVSNLHCRITEEPEGRYSVEDLGSANGTWVVLDDGTSIRIGRKTLLPSGARVRIGRTVLDWMTP